MRGNPERGLTLVEITVVMALAVVVVMGLLTFYFSSQASWLDGSTQALAQRDGTLIVGVISERARDAFRADVRPVPDSLRQTLVLFDKDDAELWRFWWDPADSRIHQGPGVGQDKGCVADSRVTRFQLDTLREFVAIRMIELQAGDGKLVRTASGARLYNRGER